MLTDIIGLISFMIYLIYSIKLMRKENRFKLDYLFLIGGSLGIIWFIINFFIPGIYLPLVPTQEEIEFTRLFGYFFNGLIQDIVLIFSLGITPLLFYSKNKLIEKIKYLALGALIQIISILISVGPDYYGLLSLPQLIISGIAMGFFIYYSFNINHPLLVVFAITFFISRLFLVIII